MTYQCKWFSGLTHAHTATGKGPVVECKRLDSGKELMQTYEEEIHGNQSKAPPSYAHEPGAGALKT